MWDLSEDSLLFFFALEHLITGSDGTAGACTCAVSLSGAHVDAHQPVSFVAVCGGAACGCFQCLKK